MVSDLKSRFSMLVHQLITISDEITSDQSTWEQINQNLENALHTVQTAASIKLRSEMGNGIELIRWLSKWSSRFREKNLSLLCITDDPAQLQSLELSHPDLGLRCISSLNELPKILNSLSRTDAVVQQYEKLQTVSNVVLEKADVNVATSGPQSVNPVPVQKRSSPSESFHSTDTLKNPHSTTLLNKSAEFVATKSVDFENDTTKLPQLDQTTTNDTFAKKVVQDQIIEISGEYQCDNCGTMRMYCKGDIVLCCENRECISDRTSFTLKYDLF